MLKRFPQIARLTGRIVGMGFRTEHIQHLEA
jgi:hypothetical protein